MQYYNESQLISKNTAFILQGRFASKPEQHGKAREKDVCFLYCLLPTIN